MRNLAIIALLGAAAYLQGCSALGLTQEAEALPPAAPRTVTITKTIEVPSTSENTTVRLIQVLDAAGCDFAALQITEGTSRKNSATVAIACK